MITSIAGVTIVINTLTCTLIIRYLLYAPCMGKVLPSFRLPKVKSKDFPRKVYIPL